jgi:hypothetical protein
MAPAPKTAIRSRDLIGGIEKSILTINFSRLARKFRPVQPGRRMAGKRIVFDYVSCSFSQDFRQKAHGSPGHKYKSARW